MATAKDTTKEAPVTQKWDGEDVIPLQGADLVDKATLVDVPFAITGIKMTATQEDVPYAVVEVNVGRGQLRWFNDASTGVKVECEELLRQYHNWQGEMNVWYDMPKLFCPEGLRASHYTKKVNGKDQPATTYYFTKAGTARP